MLELYNFVRRYYLSLKTCSFPQASLSENCLLLGIDNVHEQLCKHIFGSNSAIVYILYIMPTLISCSGNCFPVLCSFSPPSFSPTPPQSYLYVALPPTFHIPHHHPCYHLLSFLKNGVLYFMSCFHGNQTKPCETRLWC